MTEPPKKLITYAEFEHYCGPQLAGCGFPLELWGILFDKLRNEIFDAGESLQLARVETDDETASDAAEESEQPGGEEKTSAEEDVSSVTGEQPSNSPVVLAALHDLPAAGDVWLIDHAWTFRVREARNALEAEGPLRRRVAGILLGDEDRCTETDAMYERLWHVASTYRIATEESLDEECCWYLMDEVGSAVQHVEQTADGNCRLVPLYYPPSQLALSVLWLTDDVSEGSILQFCDALERSRCPGILRCMHALQDHGALDDDVEQQLIAAFDAFHSALTDAATSTSASEQLQNPARVTVPALPTVPSRSVRVASDLSELVDNIRQVQQSRRDGHDQCSVTYDFDPDLNKADIIWLAEFQETPLRISYPAAWAVSQLGIETTLCHKDHMRRMVRRVYGEVPWLPATYDAATEMHLFAGHFAKKQRAITEGSKSRNLWIVKPHCMARSIDMVVSDCLPLLLRQGETGPKILCEYIANPCLFRGRKFDLRVIVAVQALHPVPIVYCYNRVWPRFALEPYSLDHFDTYEKHWTVMNYANPEKMINLRHDDFIIEFDDIYGAGQWSLVMNRIKAMTVSLFRAVSIDTKQNASPSTCGPAAATVYGMDVMLTEDLQPMLLECTFAPDCHRACVQYPTFFADVFSTLFEGRPVNFDRLPIDANGTMPELVFDRSALKDCHATLAAAAAATVD